MHTGHTCKELLSVVVEEGSKTPDRTCSLSGVMGCLMNDYFFIGQVLMPKIA